MRAYFGRHFIPNAHNQIYHILRDRRENSITVNVRSFREADYDTDHCVEAAKVRERLTVSKQVARKFVVERFNLTKLSELEVTK
jgi:hypothetical protein